MLYVELSRPVAKDATMVCVKGQRNNLARKHIRPSLGGEGLPDRPTARVYVGPSDSLHLAHADDDGNNMTMHSYLHALGPMKAAAEQSSIP